MRHTHFIITKLSYWSIGLVAFLLFVTLSNNGCTTSLKSVGRIGQK